MSDHFIKNIEIKNFKCFEDFKAEGFGRVNLIGGKNNVGKTAFMEACYINVQEQSQAIADIIYSRYQVDLFDEFMKEVGIKYLYNFVQKKSENIKNGEIFSNLKKITVHYNEDDWRFGNSIENIIYFNTAKKSKQLYDTLYSVIIENNLEEELDTFIQEFDESISKFRIINSEPKCSKKNNEKFYNINEFGDGLSKFIAYLSLVLASKEGIVFIDEIENGIHYSNLDKLWEIILTISKEQNVQVFATTHSKECIESYARVAKRLEDEEIRFIELFKHEDKIKTMVLDNEMLQLQLKQNHEVR